MNSKDYVALAITASLLVGFVVGGLSIMYNAWDIQDIQIAIQQCEAELPRHLHCDYRIEAFVVEGKDAL